MSPRLSTSEGNGDGRSNVPNGRFGHTKMNAGELHWIISSYLSAGSHHMPLCCAVMRQEMRRYKRTETIFETESGQSACLTIRYCLPREKPRPGEH